MYNAMNDNFFESQTSVFNPTSEKYKQLESWQKHINELEKSIELAQAHIDRLEEEIDQEELEAQDD